MYVLVYHSFGNSHQQLFYSQRNRHETSWILSIQVSEVYLKIFFGRWQQSVYYSLSSFPVPLAGFCGHTKRGSCRRHQIEINGGNGVFILKTLRMVKNVIAAKLQMLSRQQPLYTAISYLSASMSPIFKTNVFHAWIIPSYKSLRKTMQSRWTELKDKTHGTAGNSEGCSFLEFYRWNYFPNVVTQIVN